VPDSDELDETVVWTLRQSTGKAVSGRMVRNYLTLLRLPTEVQELANAASWTGFRLRPVVGLDEPDHQVRIVERIVEVNLIPDSVLHEQWVVRYGALALRGSLTRGILLRD
jgi:hypothetical protein